MTSHPGTFRPILLAAALALLATGCTGGGEDAVEPDGTPRGRIPDDWVTAAAEQRPPASSGGGSPIVDLTAEQKCAIPWKPAIGSEKAELTEVLNDEQDDGSRVHKCSFSGAAPVSAGLVRYKDGDALSRTYADLIAAGASEHVEGDQTVALLRQVFPNKRTEYIVMVPDPDQLASFDLEIESPGSGFGAKDAVGLAVSALD
ncbi:hypothetical protein CLV63_12051 [Murinocardiopsis flavida]|uniref:DUF3558 domain-containing protein n=1 Tax=Murinocardiopsis flavida TaxID=645275 RepID=A0A2P8D273_9ACTN|nr:hypothetical protein [Murinocardiopsis flavida]PSK91325.1 hypothetical protein CLV63_12051 [Murinocardiopsis flavida]